MVRTALVALTLGVLAAVPAPAEPAPKDTAATVDGFLSALQHRDFKAAAAYFDANLKTALPPTELASVWKSETEKFGTLASWTTVQKATAGGKDVRLVMLKFDHGELADDSVHHPLEPRTCWNLLRARPGVRHLAPLSPRRGGPATAAWRARPPRR